MDKLIGDARPEPEILEILRARTEGDWYAYQNHDLGHPEIGHLTFLQVGKKCTFKEPPNKYPDTHLGLGWRYLLVGKVNLETGAID